MKKVFTFVSAMLFAVTMSAQAIVIDGAKADWAEIPMVTEPGAYPMLKVVVPQEGLDLGEGIAFAAMLEVAAGSEDIVIDAPVLYVDADQDSTTGFHPWVLPALGYEYEMASWSGTAQVDGKFWELIVPEESFSNVPFGGAFNTSLTYNWGTFYVPTDPQTQGWIWSEKSYKPYIIDGYSFAPLAGTHVPGNLRHEVMQLTEEGAANFSNSDNEREVEFWLSWPVEVTPATYTVTCDATSTDNASCDLYLVDMGTNEVVATLMSAEEGIWAPEAPFEVGSWNLSAVPAGKYMLKMKNHIKWSHMLLNGITITKSGDPEPEPETGLQDVVVAPHAQKAIIDGQVVILRNGEKINVLGTRL